MKQPLSKLITLIFIITLLVTSVAAQRRLNCGTERWPVKTASDTDISNLFVNGRLKRARRTTIEAMSLFQYPFPNPRSLPREWWDKRIPSDRDPDDAENNIWMIRAKLVEYSYEGDDDYHLMLEDSKGNQMVAEIPHPACLGRRTPRVLRDMITRARADFDSHFRAGSRPKTANVMVELAGIGMYDRDHGQTGRADNGIELHPVIAFKLAR